MQQFFPVVYRLPSLNMAAAQDSKAINITTIAFDIVSAVVSLLDLVTDIIILITWYNQDRMTFFWISISILILAQISYITVFYYNHGDSFGYWWDNLHSFISLLCTIPCAPFLSFIFWAVSENDAPLRDFIDNYLLCYNFDWNTFHVSLNQSAKRQWLESTLYKHLGFICEALVEGIICVFITCVISNIIDPTHNSISTEYSAINSVGIL